MNFKLHKNEGKMVQNEEFSKIQTNTHKLKKCNLQSSVYIKTELIKSNKLSKII